MAFKFESLRVWQMALDLSGEVHELCKRFPESERFVLTSQMLRAVDSISLNIAEGSTGQSTAEFKRFLGIALRSAIEVVGCLFLGRKRRIIEQDKFDYFYSQLTRLVKGIQSLRSSLK
jgi:four helix bundle protein